MVAGGTGGSNDECYLHRGLIGSWEDRGGMQRLTPEGWCSWCARKTKHETISISDSTTQVLSQVAYAKDGASKCACCQGNFTDWQEACELAK
eukprot:gene5461-6619_t